MIKLHHRLALIASVGLLGVTPIDASGQSSAGHAPLLELFTSQGCSSCPPADALFKSYASRNDIVALSMPVDYWDYLGWKDTLANSKFSKRQRTYARVRGDGQVYTPQVVINGHAHFVGSSKEEIELALQASTTASQAVSMRASLENGVIEINLANNGAAQEMTVWVAIVQPEVEVQVRAGENRGRKLTYYNVVRDLVPSGTWTGDTTIIKQKAATLGSRTGDRFAVIVQRGMGGGIAAAQWIKPAL